MSLKNRQHTIRYNRRRFHDVLGENPNSYDIHLKADFEKILSLELKNNYEQIP
jgi:hypothetical protein